MNPPLPDRPVDVVLHRLVRPPAALAADLAGLSVEERARAERLRAGDVRRRFVAARAALRRTLGIRLGLDPAGLALVEGPRGKPALADPALATRLAFNLSHSGDLAAIALVDGPAPPAVGVDIEAMRRLDDLDGMARIAFHPDEAAAWQALPAAERPADFYRRWTRKEAVMKAVGLGFHLAPRGFVVALDGAGRGILATASDPQAPAGSIGIADLAVPEPATAGAVALLGAQPVARMISWSPDSPVEP